MQKKLLITAVVIMIASVCFSQDLITKKNGEDIQAKVIEVGQTEIKFKRMDNLNGPLFTVAKTDVLMIRYENGTKDIFTEDNTKGLNAPEFSVVDYYRQGQMDAKKYYTHYKNAAGGTLLTTTLLSGLIGLVPAFITSSTEPDDANLGYPNKELMSNPDYYQGYTQNAKKIKSNKVWMNWGVGIGINLAVYYIVVNSM
jgi:hypothetical protein